MLTKLLIKLVKNIWSFTINGINVIDHIIDINIENKLS